MLNGEQIGALERLCASRGWILKSTTTNGYTVQVDERAKAAVWVSANADLSWGTFSRSKTGPGPVAGTDELDGLKEQVLPEVRRALEEVAQAVAMGGPGGAHWVEGPPELE
jgi:hypothetical protein